jgi:hypothetical protein
MKLDGLLRRFAPRNDGLEQRAAPSIVVARLDRAIQYPRGVSDGVEKPQRTGSSGQAGR